MNTRRVDLGAFFLCTPFFLTKYSLNFNQDLTSSIIITAVWKFWVSTIFCWEMYVQGKWHTVFRLKWKYPEIKTFWALKQWFILNLHFRKEISTVLQWNEILNRIKTIFTFFLFLNKICHSIYLSWLFCFLWMKNKGGGNKFYLGSIPELSFSCLLNDCHNLLSSMICIYLFVSEHGVTVTLQLSLFSVKPYLSSIDTDASRRGFN